jgi:hypothetical protein
MNKIGRKQDAYFKRAGIKGIGFRIKRQDRNNNTKTDQVNKNCGKDYCQRFGEELFFFRRDRIGPEILLIHLNLKLEL